MYRVLVAIDEDEERAKLLADAVAKLPDADRSVEATVLHVFEDVEAPPAAAIQEPPRRDEDADEEGDRKRFPASVERVREVLEGARITHEVRGERGDPDETILDVADELSADAIYIGGKNRSPSGKLLFGSVAQDVLFGTERPVTVIGGHDRELL